MTDKFVISCSTEADFVLKRIFNTLTGKTFYVVSINSAHMQDVTVFEGVRTKGDGPVVKNEFYKIDLDPRRSLGFSINEKPVVEFVSPERIDITRRVTDRDTVTRIILIK